MARTVTAAQLVRLGACREQVALFRATFGKSVAVTRDAAIAHADKFSWTWAADHLLTPAQRAAYDAAMASAGTAYAAAMASAFADAFNS